MFHNSLEVSGSLRHYYNETQHPVVTKFKLSSVGFQSLYTLNYLCLSFVDPTFCFEFSSTYVVSQNWHTNIDSGEIM
jgi:hypothetical protein